MIDDKRAAGFQRQMSFKQYKKYKLRILTDECYLPLTEEELERYKTFTTTAQIDSFFVTMLNKYWH